MADNSTESNLAKRLASGKFAMTAEITPPVSASAAALMKKAEVLGPHVDAINVTDGASARVHMSSVTAAAILVANGIEPVAQFTCRDRNRIALLSDLLGAGALGIKNMLMLTGDDPSAGDQPDAKPVFDYSSGDLIKIASEMTDPGIIPSSGAKEEEGVPADHKRIDGTPNFFVGAADMPAAERGDRWPSGLNEKRAGGAKFCQTQLCYDMDVVRKYGEILVEDGYAADLSFLIGSGPLPSARSAIWMRDNLWGVVMPDAVIERLEGADDPKAEGVKICIEQLQEMSEMPGIAGVHLMAPINTSSIPAVITGSGLRD
jgi:methylenetetrahydrofolate reductase (NADPH)